MISMRVKIMTSIIMINNLICKTLNKKWTMIMIKNSNRVKGILMMNIVFNKKKIKISKALNNLVNQVKTANI